MALVAAAGAFVALLALSPAAVQAASSCSDCSGQTCMLDGTATAVTGGATSISVQFCNYDSSSNDSYVLAFGVTTLPSCDSSNNTLPAAQSLAAADGCTSDACAVTVTFESAIDWAIALQNNGVSNALTAQLTAGGSDEVVTVATFETMAAAVMAGDASGGSSSSVSVCSTAFGISGSRFSTVEACNVAQICQGASADTTCTTELQSGALVGDVSCNGEACTGSVTLSEALPCDGSSGTNTALLVGVTVASSTQSNVVSVGNMATPNFSIADASGVNVGSSELVLTTDTFCAASTIQLNVSEGASSSSSASSVDVSSLNATSNGTIVVELASPLSSSLEGSDLQFSLSQCGVSTSAEFSVDEDEDADASSSSSTEATEASADGSEAVGGSSTGTEATQEENGSTGLSHGVIVGIVIAVVALLGFMFECVHHKRRQPLPAPQDSTVNNLTTPL